MVARNRMGAHVWLGWLMPLFGLVCMIIFLYGVSRIFGRGSCAGQHPAENPQQMDQLIREVRELRAEIKALKEHKTTGEDSS